jgi:hypothetical protein
MRNITPTQRNIIHLLNNESPRQKHIAAGQDFRSVVKAFNYRVLYPGFHVQMNEETGIHAFRPNAILVFQNSHNIDSCCRYISSGGDNIDFRLNLVVDNHKYEIHWTGDNTACINKIKDVLAFSQ